MQQEIGKKLIRLFEQVAIKDKFIFDCDMDEAKQTIVRDFCDFCQKKLNIKEMPEIRLVAKKEADMSTGAYIPSANKVLALAGHRAILDILRSIGHELTHRMQDETGILDKIPVQGDRKAGDMSDVGVDFEDEANAKGGALIKEFSRKYGKVPFETLFEL
jgi:hypothetical protein